MKLESLKRPNMKFFSNIFDKIFAVCGAIVFCQGPLIIQQYTLRLAGHLEENSLAYEQIVNLAKTAHKSIQEYLDAFVQNPEPIISAQGKFLQDVCMRHFSLVDAWQSLQNASPISKPFIFFRHIDFDILKNTLTSFSPGFAFNLETIVYGFLGLLFGTFSYYLLCKMFAKFLSIFKKKEKAPESAAQKNAD